MTPAEKELARQLAQRFELYLKAWFTKASKASPLYVVRTQFGIATTAEITTRVIVRRLVTTPALKDLGREIVTLLIHEKNVGRDLTFRQRTRVGAILVILFEKATGAVRFTSSLTRIGGPKMFATKEVHPTDETLAWMNRNKAIFNSLDHITAVSHTPHGDWQDFVINDLLEFIRPSKKNHFTNTMANAPLFINQQERIAAAAMAMSTANRLQRTAWRVNPQVLSVLETAFRSKRSIADLPSSEPPQKPNSQTATKVEWGTHFDLKRRWDNRRRLMALHLSEARHFGDRPLHWRWNADFRGRIYPIARTNVHPQGPDLARALLDLDEGKVIGDKWNHLAYHGANEYGINRKSRQDRLDWVLENTDEICRIAEDPWANDHWCHASHPWRYLRFCFEWARFQKQGEDMITNLPCQIDATASGMQIIALLTNDAELGAMVNLTDTDTPSDFYTQICDIAYPEIRKTNDGMLWEQTHGRIPRAPIKLACFTISYGGGPGAASNKVRTWMRDETERYPFDGKSRTRLSSIIAQEVFKAVRQTGKQAAELTQWLKDLRFVAKERNSWVHWKTPSGFVVVSDYRKGESVRIGLSPSCDENQAWEFFDTVPTPHLNLRRIGSTMPVNFIHAMDAAIMHHIGVEMNREGIPFGANHDCVSVTATDMERTHAIVRGSYRKVFSQDILGSIADDFGVDRFQVTSEKQQSLTQFERFDYMWT